MTRLGRSIVLTGELTSAEDVAVEGQVHGRISVKDATLTISKDAELEADCRGARVQVHGKVVGNIAATERIELHASADVDGSLSANRVVIADGAKFGGRIDMDQRTIAAKVAQFKAEQGA